MRKILSLLLVFICFTSFSSTEQYVYICKGKKSECYHYKSDCRGLKNCSTDIYKTTLSEAKKMGRRECGFEK